MIGTTTLAEIRQKLREHFGKNGEDPIEWLNKRMAVAPQERRIIESIIEVLENPKRPKKPVKKTKVAKKR